MPASLPPILYAFGGSLFSLGTPAANQVIAANSGATGFTLFTLGTAASAAASSFLAVANNLSDVASVSTARTNLGLGTAAQVNTGTGSGNVPVLASGGSLNLATGATYQTAGITILRYNATTFNTFVGLFAGNATQTASGNSALGQECLNALTSGTCNFANGFQTLTSLTTGSFNVASGAKAGGLTTTSSGNSFFGSFAGYNNTTGSNNTLIGYQAGYTDGTTATPNNLSNATAIGYNAQVTASNCLVLGGTGSYTVNVGIGKAAPTVALDVVGSIAATSTVKPGAFTVATLPTPGTFSRRAGASNGRRSGEGAGAGTGCPVWDDGTNWRTYYDNSVVAA